MNTSSRHLHYNLQMHVLWNSNRSYDKDNGHAVSYAKKGIAHA